MLYEVITGDLLTVEVLEGRRQVLQIPVLGITKQYLGVSAYMRQDSLNEALGEGNVVTGAYLSHDPGVEQVLYDRLEGRPRVLGMVVITSYSIHYTKLYDNFV